MVRSVLHSRQLDYNKSTSVQSYPPCRSIQGFLFPLFAGLWGILRGQLRGGAGLQYHELWTEQASKTPGISVTIDYSVYGVMHDLHHQQYYYT